MKRHGILNAELNGQLSRLGHTDIVVVVDCGMPIPRDVPVVDLALVQGIPRFEHVLDALLQDLVFERCIIATEAKSQEAERWLTSRFDVVDYVTHAELKDLSASAKLIVRTGEATPYANAALICGVAF